MTANCLVVIRADYHVYTHAICGLNLEEVLKTTKMKVWPVNLKEEVMVVYETQLKCGLRLPLSKFLDFM